MTIAPRFGPGALRLMLAGMVFVSHVSRFNVGIAAVVVFFMLSGYWVAQLYDRRRTASVLPYLADRGLRVWPLLASVAIAIVVINAAAGSPVTGSLASTLLLLGLATRHGDVIGVAWSLDLELQFYLLLPLALAAVARVPRGCARRVAAIALVVAATLAGVLLRRHDVVTALFYAPAFAAGVAIWRADWRPGPIVAATSVALFVVAAAAATMIPVTQGMLLKGGQPVWWFNLVHMAWCALLVPFVAWNVHQPSTPRDRHAGNLSYPFYLVHYPLVAATAGMTASVAANKGLALAAAVAATAVAYLLVDRPLEHIRKRIMATRRAPAATARGFDGDRDVRVSDPKMPAGTRRPLENCL